LKALKSPKWHERKAAADTLGNYTRFANQSIPSLLNALKDENLEVRGAAIIALGKLGKGSTDVEQHLKKLLADPNPAIEMKAISALVFLGEADDSQVNLLVNGLGMKDTNTVRTVGIALSRLMHRFPDKVADALGEALAKNQEPLLTNTLKFVRFFQTRNDKVLSSVIKSFDRVPPKVRVLVLSTALANDPTGDKSLHMITKALKDRHPAVRKEALIAAARLGTKWDTFKPALLAELRDPNADNRAVAVNIMNGLSSKIPEAAPKIISLVHDRDHGVRTAAIRALGSFPDPSSKIIRILEKNVTDKDADVRNASLFSLGNLASSHSLEVTPVLERALKSETSRKNRRLIVEDLHRAGKIDAYDPQNPPHVKRSGLIPGEELGTSYR
jgi:HEAT repeat protein